jgi:hypothetical protein
LRTALGAPANYTLKRVRVSIHEPRQQRPIPQPNRILNLRRIANSNDISITLERDAGPEASIRIN